MVRGSTQKSLCDYVDVSRWDLADPLSPAEESALDGVVGGKPVEREIARTLERFVRPYWELYGVLYPDGTHLSAWRIGIRKMLERMHAYRSPVWCWSNDQWTQVISSVKSGCLPLLVLCALANPDGLTQIPPSALAGKDMYRVGMAVFGQDFASLEQQVLSALEGIGRAPVKQWNRSDLGNLRHALAVTTVFARTTNLGPEHVPIMDRWARSQRKTSRYGVYSLCRALHAVGLLDRPTLPSFMEHANVPRAPQTEWNHDIAYWMVNQQRLGGGLYRNRGDVESIARWFTANVPHVRTPQDLDLKAVMKFRATVNYAKHGDFSPYKRGKNKRLGESLKASRKLALLKSLRGFLVDLVDLGRVTPDKLVLAHELLPSPRLKQQVYFDPRVIEDVAFMKILTAALELTPEDTANMTYPFKLVRAMSLAWCFLGLRGNEIRRLLKWCIEDRSLGFNDDGTIAWLRVPENKYKGECGKPIAAEAAKALNEWLAERPSGQAPLLDSKTQRAEEHLFMWRGRLVGPRYLNKNVIPMLLRKAGIEGYRDRHGHISCHRMRSTIATHLAVGPNAMSLVALRDWLGHKNVNTVQAYVATTPVALANEYRRAFAVGVTSFIDLEAVRNGTADGRFMYTEVAGGMCGRDAFEACPHNMACLQDRCPDFLSGDSELAQRLRQGDRAKRIVQQIMLEPAQIQAVRRSKAPKKAAEPAKTSSTKSLPVTKVAVNAK